MNLEASNLQQAVYKLYIFTMKQKLYDWLWWNIGEKLWRKSARNHSKWEVNRRLSWMKMDNNGQELSSYQTHCFERERISKLYKEYER